MQVTGEQEFLLGCPVLVRCGQSLEKTERLPWAKRIAVDWEIANTLPQGGGVYNFLGEIPRCIQHRDQFIHRNSQSKGQF